MMAGLSMQRMWGTILALYLLIVNGL
jgi:hypothetical protein